MTLKLFQSTIIFHQLKRFLAMSATSPCSDVREIFAAAVKSVQPESLIQNAVTVRSNSIEIQGKCFPLSRNVHVVGFGKAVYGMALALESKIKDHIVSSMVSVPEGMHNAVQHRKSDSVIEVYEGAHKNLPDDNSLFAAGKISEHVASLTESDLLFVLISGGGSALLPAPKPPLTLEDKQQVITLLSLKGATIEELNAVRKRLSTLKGGGLAQLAKPAQVASLILSDIIGDPLSIIASGPTVKDEDEPNFALSIIKKYGLKEKLPDTAIQLLQQHPKDHDESFSHVSNFIIGNNEKALDAAKSHAIKLNYSPVIVTKKLCGKAKYTGEKLIDFTIAALNGDSQQLEHISEELQVPQDSIQNVFDSFEEAKRTKTNVCLIFGGETTVEVCGTGVGGRNQELALAAALELNVKKMKHTITLLSAGSDGIDGPTPAAGAIATPSVVEVSKSEGKNASKYLHNNDSYTFYSKVNGGKWLIKTGHTGTNVMDIIVILVEV